MSFQVMLEATIVCEHRSESRECTERKTYADVASVQNLATFRQDARRYFHNLGWQLRDEDDSERCPRHSWKHFQKVEP